MKVLVLNENKEGHIYSHWTNFNGLIGILQDKTLKGNTEFRHHLFGKTTVSTTREGNGKSSKASTSNILNSMEIQLPIWVKISLDIEKISHNYKTVPFEFHIGSRSKGESQHEEAIVIGDGNLICKAKIYSEDDVHVGNVVFDNNLEFIEYVEDTKGKVIDYKDDGYELEDGCIYDFEPDNDFEDNKIFQIYVYRDGEGIGNIDSSEFEVSGTPKKNKEGIKNILEYIKSIEFPDVFVKMINNKNLDYKTTDNKSLRNTLNEFLSTGKVEGLHGSNFSRQVKHSYTTIESFYKFVLSEIKKKKGKDTIEIKTYKTPSKWFKK